MQDNQHCVSTENNFQIEFPEVIDTYNPGLDIQWLENYMQPPCTYEFRNELLTLQCLWKSDVFSPQLSLPQKERKINVKKPQNPKSNQIKTNKKIQQKPTKDIFPQREGCLHSTAG